MWTFLRLLTIEQSLELFLETERKDDVPGAAELAKDRKLIDDLLPWNYRPA